MGFSQPTYSGWGAHIVWDHGTKKAALKPQKIIAPLAGIASSPTKHAWVERGTTNKKSQNPCIDKYVYIYIYMYIYIYANIDMYKYMYICKYKYVYIHIYICTHMYIYIYTQNMYISILNMYIHIYIYIYLYH